MSLYGILEAISAEFPDREALISKGVRLTYADLKKKVDCMAAALSQRGVKKGDRVAVLLRNTFEVVVAYFAIMKTGGIEVALNPVTESRQNIEYALNDCQAEFLVTHSRHAELISDTIPSLNTIIYIGEADSLLHLNKELVSFNEMLDTVSFCLTDGPDIALEDEAVIAYTSGTTGMRKGVVLTHGNLISVAEVTAKDLSLENDRCLLLIPLYHAFGKQILNSRILKGSTVLLLENILFPVEILNILESEKASGIVGVPTIYRMLLDTIKKSKREYKFPEFRYISTGGSKMPPERFVELWKWFPSITILSGYGLTETSGRGTVMIFESLSEKTKKLESCGRPPFGMKLSDREGREVGCGEIGEVNFSGPNIMKGYWKKPDETGEVLEKGWLRSGDLGYTDEEGDLYIIDRKKDILKSAGEIISPKEIEIIIETHPAVKEAAVIGIEDEVLGEKIKAFVVLNDDSSVSKDEIIDYCSENLPFAKIPAVVEFRSKLPKSTLDKIKKAVLREEETNG
ncbi:MAG: class I adenylate-forming enzyme family protein [Elusimicrobiota bacterium]